MAELAPYDAIARKYAHIAGRELLQRYAIYPSFDEAIGNVTDLSVLDLACGEGLVARAMAAAGASKVIGIDLSAEMIKIARERHPAGSPIQYRQGRLGRLGAIDQFDRLTVGFGFHYAGDIFELHRMARDAARNLKPGGILVSANSNPFTLDKPELANRFGPLPSFPRSEGDPMRWTLSFDGVEVSFTNFFWKPETYERAFRTAGFTVEWLPVRPTEEAIQLLGEEYWRDFLAAPSVVLLKCVKL